MNIETNTFETVMVNNWELAIHHEDKIPRILDITLAEKLGYDRPMDIRKLVNRLVEHGKLPGIYSERHMARGLNLGKNKTMQEITVYYLDINNTLRVIRRCETEKADAVMEEVNQVFIKYIYGTLENNFTTTKKVTPRRLVSIYAAYQRIIRLSGVTNATEIIKTSDRLTKANCGISPLELLNINLNEVIVDDYKVDQKNILTIKYLKNVKMVKVNLKILKDSCTRYDILSIGSLRNDVEALIGKMIDIIPLNDHMICEVCGGMSNTKCEPICPYCGHKDAGYVGTIQLESESIPQLPYSPKDSPKGHYMIPTEIGKFLGNISPISVNLILEKAGFQVRNFYGNYRWVATTKGKKFAKIVLLKKLDRAGAPIRQLMWNESIIQVLRKMMNLSY